MSCGLDMCCRTRYALTGENSYHIEFDRRENISILQSKNIEQTLVCISTKGEQNGTEQKSIK